MSLYILILYKRLLRIFLYGLPEQNIPTSDLLDNLELYKENSYQVVAWIATADSGGKCQT